MRRHPVNMDVVQELLEEREEMSALLLRFYLMRNDVNQLMTLANDLPENLCTELDTEAFWDKVYQT